MAYNTYIDFFFQVYLKRHPQTKCHHYMHFWSNRKLIQNTNGVVSWTLPQLLPHPIPPHPPAAKFANWDRQQLAQPMFCHICLLPSALSKAILLSFLSSNRRWSLRSQSLCISRRSILPSFPSFWRFLERKLIWPFRLCLFCVCSTSSQHCPNPAMRI